MGAPKGNQNAAKGKRWQDALHKALARFENGTCKRGEALDRIALKVVEDALEGSVSARDEIANRLDGKPHQSMDVQYTELPADEMTDAELFSIAGRGRRRASKAQASETEPPELH